MAVRAHSTTAFIDKLLAPLPEGEEPADSLRYRKQIERDLYHAWNAGMMRVELASARHMVAAREHQLDISRCDRTWEAYKARMEAEQAQCLIPAPTAMELRWKKRAVKLIAALSDPEPADRDTADLLEFYRAEAKRRGE